MWCFFFISVQSSGNQRPLHQEGGCIMAAVESLEVQLTASARSAIGAIDEVNRKLDGLLERLSAFGKTSGICALNAQTKELSKNLEVASAKLKESAKSFDRIDTSGIDKLGKIEGSNFRNLGEGVRELSSGLKNLQGIKKTDFNRLAFGIERLSVIPTGDIQTVANTLKPLADGVSILSNTNFDNKSLQSLISSLKRLSNSNVSALSNVDFVSIGNSLKNLTNSFAGAEKVQQSTISMTNAIARLADSGANIPTVSSALSQLGASLKNFMSTMSSAPAITTETTAFTQAIAQLSNAGTKVSTTASNLGMLATELKSFMQTMSNAPVISDSTIRMTQALANLASQGNKTSSATQGLQSVFSNTENIGKKFNNSIKRLSSSMKGLGDSVKKTASKMKSFKTELLSALGVVGGLYGAIRGIGKSLDISSDLVEVQNVVDTAFGDMAYKVEEFAQTSIEQFGMSELALKQYASRFQAMGTAMGINSSLISSANKNLEKITGGYVNASGAMADVSLNLTKLTADLASFYNMEQDMVAQDLESIFTGQTRPLRTYGLDLTEATLKEWALKQGLDADMKSMSQAEKTMLRYQYVMTNTKVAQGDFAKTANTWANQIRILRQQFEQLASIIGTAFRNMLKPVVQSLNTAMAKVIQFAQTVINALGKIFGWKFEVNTKGIAEDFSGIEDGIGGIADGIDDASNSAKKFNKQLQGFDALNNLTTSDPDKVKDIGSALGNIGNIGEIVEAEGILDGYESKLDTIYKLGRYLGKTLKDFLSDIPWENIKRNAHEAGEGLADLINGFTEVQGLGYTLGKTLAESINTGFEFLNSFVHRLHWSSIGTFIAEELNGFFENIDWELIRDTFITGFKGLANAINQFIADFHWDNISNTISNAINIIAETVYTFFSTVKWDELGSELGEQLKKTIEKIDWEMVGRTIGSVLQSAFDFLKSFLKQQDFGTVIDAISDLLKGFFDEVDTGDLALAITAVLGAAFAKISFKAIIAGLKYKAFSSMLAKAFGSAGESAAGTAEAVGGLSGALKSLGGLKYLLTASFGDLAELAGAGTAAEAGTVIGTSLLAGLAGALAGGLEADFLNHKVIGPIVSLFDEELGAAYKNFSWFGDGGFFSALNLEDFKGAISEVKKDFDKLMGGISQKWDNIKNGWNELVENIKNAEWIETIREKVSSIGEWFSNAWNNAKEAWTTATQWFDETIIQPVSGFFEGLGTRIQQVFEGLRIIVEAIWITVSNWFNENVVSPIASMFQKLKETIQNAWATVSTWFNDNVITPVANFFQGLWEKVSGFFTQLWEDIKLVWTTVSEWFNQNVERPVTDSFKNVWNNVSDFFLNLWEDIQTIWGVVSGWFDNNIIIPVQNAFETACDAIGDFFSGLWEGIKKGVVGAMNAVLSGIERAINFIVNGINSLIGGFNKIVSWNAKVAEVNWGGVDLVPTVALPRVELATGGIVYKPTYAEIGEAGKEGILPLTNRAAMSQMVNEIMASATSGGQHNETYGRYGQDNLQTDALLMSQNQLLQQQNELLRAILQKPTITNQEAYNAVQSVYSEKAIRKYGTSAPGVPVWG